MDQLLPTGVNGEVVLDLITGTPPYDCEGPFPPAAMGLLVDDLRVE